MKEKQRNYQIDVLKFVFAIFIFFSHTYPFIGENTRFLTVRYVGQFGWWGVFVFFIVSGMLMVNSVYKSNSDVSQAGKNAFTYIVNKFKKIALEYWVALFLIIAVFFVFNDADIISVLRSFPEIFCLNSAGVKTGEFNTTQWYLSAMLFSMLPLCYLLYRNKDMYIYVCAPILAFVSYGYLYNYETSPTPSQYAYNGIIYLGIIRAVTGICFGAISWLISEKIRESIKNNSSRVFLTCLELLLYAIVFLNWIFNISDSVTAYSVNLLLPVAIGISFSGKSYICKLFQKKIFSCLPTLTLAIYFNQIAARKIVLEAFSDKGYKESLFLMIVFTVLLSAVYFLMLKLLKLLYSKVKKI